MAAALAFSCYRCRASKLRCDRKQPCGRCSGAGETCEFPTSRQRPSQYARRVKARDVEVRLKRLEQLEGHADALLPTGRREWALPAHAVEQLTTLYFATFHIEMPMLHPERYRTSLLLPVHMQPALCLQYAVLAVAALSQSPHHDHHSLHVLGLPCYQRAREYLHRDELLDDGQQVLTLAHAQAWLLLAVYESLQRWYTRASLSIGRAARLAQMLGLFDIDSPLTLRRGASLAPSVDWSDREQRCRTIWAIFCFDRTHARLTGWTTSVEHARVKSLLPASEEAYLNGVPQSSTSLHDALVGDSSSLSTFACRVIAEHLAHETSEHSFQEDDDRQGRLAAVEDSVFWAQHQQLDSSVASAFLRLPDHLRFPAHANDRDCVFVNLRLHTANICLCRTAMAKAFHNPRRTAHLKGASASLLPSSSAIFDLVIRRDALTVRDPITAFAAFAAGLVFFEDFLENHDKKSEDKVIALMELLLSISETSPSYAALALRLAQELHKFGFDRYAMDEVNLLMASVTAPEPADGRCDPKRHDVEPCPFTVIRIRLPPSPPTSTSSSS